MKKPEPKLFTEQEARDFQGLIAETLGKKLAGASLVLREYGLTRNPENQHWYLVCFIERLLDGRVIKLSSPFAEGELDDFVDKTYGEAIKAFYAPPKVKVVGA